MSSILEFHGYCAPGGNLGAPVGELPGTSYLAHLLWYRTPQIRRSSTRLPSRVGRGGDSRGPQGCGGPRAPFGVADVDADKFNTLSR